jgi:hypothetical protein
VETSTRFTDPAAPGRRGRNLLRAAIAAVAAVPAFVLALPVAVLAAPFLIVSRLTRLLASALEPPVVPWAEVLRDDPVVGWHHRPGLRAFVHNMNGDAFRFETDDEGWRGRRSIDESDVLVFGDSFAFGYSVDEDELFANMPGPARIKSLGVLGYSMVQPLLWMERLGARLHGKTVIWLIYEGNDLDDALRPDFLGRKAPFLRESPDRTGWELVGHAAHGSPWPFQLHGTNYERFVDICCDSPYARRVFSAAEYLVRRARDTCEAAGAELVVMTVPELSPIQLGLIERTVAQRDDAAAFDPDLPDRRMADICNRLDVHFMPLKGRLTTGDYLKYDVHWNARGNRRLAAIIQELYVRQRPVAERGTHQGSSPEDEVPARARKAVGGNRWQNV